MAATVLPSGAFRRAVVVMAGGTVVFGFAQVYAGARADMANVLIYEMERAREKEANCINDEKCARAKAYQEELEREMTR